MNRIPFTLSRSVVAVGVVACCTIRLLSAEINFDNYTNPANNDLVNLFLVGGFQQVTNRGISGGAVLDPLSLPLGWLTGGYAGYRIGQSQPTPLSISFLYDGPETPGHGVSARLGWA